MEARRHGGLLATALLLASSAAIEAATSYWLVTSGAYVTVCSLRLVTSGLASAPQWAQRGGHAHGEARLRMSQDAGSTAPG